MKFSNLLFLAPFLTACAPSSPPVAKDFEGRVTLQCRQEGALNNAASDTTIILDVGRGYTINKTRVLTSSSDLNSLFQSACTSDASDKNSNFNYCNAKTVLHKNGPLIELMRRIDRDKEWALRLSPSWNRALFTQEKFVMSTSTEYKEIRYDCSVAHTVASQK